MAFRYADFLARSVVECAGFYFGYVMADDAVDRTASRVDGGLLFLLENSLRMAAMAPECVKVFSSRIAPKMIPRLAPVRIRPCSVDARTRLKVITHAVSTITAALMGTTGIARRAGQLKATSRMAARISGKKGKQG